MLTSRWKGVKRWQRKQRSKSDNVISSSLFATSTDEVPYATCVCWYLEVKGFEALGIKG